MGHSNGGPRKWQADWKEIAQLIQAGCPGKEVAHYYGIHHETLYDRCLEDLGIPFIEFKRNNRSRGDALLRLAQMKNALRGEKTLLIWLGKQRLGQRDNPDFKEEFNGQLSQLLECMMKLNGTAKELDSEQIAKMLAEKEETTNSDQQPKPETD